MNRSVSNLDREKPNQFHLLSLIVAINPKWNQYRAIPTRTNILSLPLSLVQISNERYRNIKPPPFGRYLKMKFAEGEKLSCYQPAIVTPEARAIL